MNLRQLAPWNWGKQKLPVRREPETDLPDFLRRDVNRLFDTFPGRFTPDPFRDLFGPPETFVPKVDVHEDDKALRVTAEVPDLDVKEIDLSVSRDALTISGEKREEKRHDDRDYHLRECVYGSFRRVVPLPCEIASDKIDACFKKGVLTVTLPKSESALARRRRIEIQDA